MAGIPIELSEVVEYAAQAALDEVHKAIPAQVTAYDPLTNTIVAKPIIKRPLYTASGVRKFEELPEIPFVPVMWPRGAGFVVRMPLQEGDHVLLVFSDYSCAEWRESGDLSEPVDSRKHAIGWPFAIPGAAPDTDPLSPLDAVEVAAEALIIGKDGDPANQMIVGGTIPGVRFGKLAVSPVALAVPLLTYVAAAGAAASAGGASDTAAGASLTAIQAALVAIQAALAAIVAIPANAGAAPYVASSGTAVTSSGTAAAAAATATAASATAGAAAASAATTAAGAVPSTVVKAL